MDMGKYVAVGVLAVIVLAAATYDKPETKAGQAAAQAEVAGGSEPVYAVDYGSLDQGEAAITSAAFSLPVQPIAPAQGALQVAKADAAKLTPIQQAKNTLEYVVKAEQTLSDVAGEVFGDRGAWRKLYEANKDRLSDPNQIRAGMKLVYEKINASDKAPTRAQRQTTSLPASAPRAAGRNYTVKQGETLYRIAKAQLGSGGRWKEIAELNRLDGSTLRANQVILLPQR